jgi:3-phosphoshikimate 1-carboxyvinyltransferase
MKIKVEKSRIDGEISVPGSKSHTIRAVAVACMAEGTSIIRAPLVSGDTLSALNAAEAFGANILKEDGKWTISGVGGKIRQLDKPIYMGNSGTSLRIFSGLAAVSGHKVAFDGDGSLRTRPMSPLLDALGMLGVKFETKEGKCPLWLQGPIAGGKTRINGQSSQFLTSLLFAVPLAEEDTVIEVYNLNEKPYVEITLDWLSRQGIEFDCNASLERFEIKGGQRYKSFDLSIPADFSTATFPLVAAAVTGGKAIIRNLDFEDRQGDKAVFSYLEKMGMTVEKHAGYTEVSLDGKLKGAEIDINSTPDALPAMAVAACFAEGKTALLNVPQARIKETDRIDCMTKELRKMGAKIEELEDGMIIEGSSLKGAEVEGYADHRIVMALAIAGLNADGETIINESEAAAVTYPDFVKDFKKMGADFQEI